MASVLALGLVVLLVAGHTVVAAVLTRLLRVRLSSRWGPLVYAAVLVPVVLVLSTMVLSGVLRLGPNLGEARTVLFVLVVLPGVLGVTIDYLWMPAPENVELPETT